MYVLNKYYFFKYKFIVFILVFVVLEVCNVFYE